MFEHVWNVTLIFIKNYGSLFILFVRKCMKLRIRKFLIAALNSTIESVKRKSEQNAV